jgi:hypothetical protein
MTRMMTPNTWDFTWMDFEEKINPVASSGRSFMQASVENIP